MYTRTGEALLGEHHVRAVTVNTGSSSVKLALYEGPLAQPRRLWSESYPRSAEAIPTLRALRERVGDTNAVIGHRVVHGGTRFTQPALIDQTVMAALEALSPLAPLHNPRALAWIRAARSVFGTTLPQVAVFDTAYFARLPRVAAEYALPSKLAATHGIRRYGFHGLAHESLWRGWCRLNSGLSEGGRLITLQLGSGCSMAAILEGRPQDTTMGFSPLEGLVMATRCGDLDAAVVPFLETQLARSGAEVLDLLETQSGLAGVAGSDANPAALAQSADPQAHFALELYCYRIRKYLGAFIAVLGGCDGIVFGGGVGEHVPQVRAAALTGLRHLGLSLDEARNAAARGQAACISAAGSVPVHVLPSDEEVILANAAFSLLCP